MQMGPTINAATHMYDKKRAQPMLGIGPMASALQEASPLLLAMSKGLLSGDGVGAHMGEGIALMDRRRKEREQKQQMDTHAKRLGSRLGSFPVAAASRTRGATRPLPNRTLEQEIGDSAMAALGKPGAMSLTGLFGQLEQQHGLPTGYLHQVAQIESGGNQYAQNPNSSAGGMFQFIDSTAQRYGLTDKTDPHASAQAAARLAADNATHLRQVLGREPTAAELYLAHQQGAGGAAKLLANPNTPASDVVGHDAVMLNGGNMHMSAGEFANQWLGKFGGGQNPSMVEVASNDPSDLIALLAHPSTTPQQARAIQMQYELEMRQRNQAGPNYSIQELADGRKYYIDPTGQQAPRLVAPNLMPTPPAPADEYGRYAAEERKAGRAPLSRIQYAQAKKGGGFNVTTPDGTTISYGGGNQQGFGTKATNDIEGRILDSGAMLGRLNDTRKLFKPEYLEISTRIGAKWGQLLDKMGSATAEQQEIVANFAQFKTEAFNNLNTTLKELSGAAVTPQEAERLLEQLPSVGTGILDGDSPTEFQAKLEQSILQQKRAVARYNLWLATGRQGKPWELSSLDDLDKLINQRGEQIEQQLRAAGFSDEAVIKQQAAQQLRAEVGI